MMTLRQIRHFIAVAETGSISSAAQTAFISQSTLTLAIQQLEEEIGVSLFSRHAKGMTLTHQGHQFLRQAHLILATVDNAKRSLQQSTDQVAGQLIVGVTSLVAGYYLADLLTRFQRAYPNVEIRVMEDERPYIEHLLVSGEIDVGVLILSNLEDRHALQTEVLTHSPHRLWLPAQHPLLEHDSINLADVAREPLIQLNVDEMDRNAQRLWRGAGLQPKDHSAYRFDRSGTESGRRRSGGFDPTRHDLSPVVTGGRHHRSAADCRPQSDPRRRSGLAPGHGAAGARRSVSHGGP
jgi:DNA-binding transcriptional LysR family regulator